MTLDDLYGICETYNVDFGDYLIIKEYVEELQATIEAQEIIIKDKSAIMEAMVQPKTCAGCKHAYTCFIIESLMYSMSINDFCCNKYEPKEQQ